MTWLTHTAFAGLTAWVFGLNTGIAIAGSTAPDWFEDLFGIHEHRGLTNQAFSRSRTRWEDTKRSEKERV